MGPGGTSAATQAKHTWSGEYGVGLNVWLGVWWQARVCEQLSTNAQLQDMQRQCPYV